MTDTDTLIEFLDKKIDDVRASLSSDIRRVVDLYETRQREFVTWPWFRMLTLACCFGFGVLLAIIVSTAGAEKIAEVAPKAILGTIK